MADNTVLNSMSGGDTIATDDVSGVKFQKIKLDVGGDGVSLPVSTDNPIPVSLPESTVTTLTPPAAITGFSTSAKQDTSNSYLSSMDGKITACNTGSISGSVTANAGTNLNTSALALESGGNLATIAGKDFATQTTLSAINSKMVSGTDIGDVTINNGSGAAAVNIQDGGNTITVDGTVAVTNAGITTIAGAVAGTEMQVDVITMPTVTVNSHAVTNAGTFAVQATAVGTIADDATTPGSPIMIGGQAKETDGTDPGSVSGEDDVARLITDRNRRLLVNQAHPNLWTVTHAETTAQTDHELKAAPGAGLSLYVTDVIISNGATAGTVILELDGASAKTPIIGPLYLAANGGAVINFNTPIRITANKNIALTSATVTTHSVTVNGYTAP